MEEEEVVEPRGEGGGNKEMGGEEREDKSKSRQQGGRGRIRELVEEARKEGREAAKASLSAFEKAPADFCFNSMTPCRIFSFKEYIKRLPFPLFKIKKKHPRWQLSRWEHEKVH